MKIKFTLLFLVFGCSVLLSQKTTPQYLPEPSIDAPEWMNLFYTGITDINQIEEAYNLYYKTNQFKKNTYTQYYKRWVIENQRNQQDDGSIIKLGGSNIQSSNRNSNSTSSIGSWSLIGPVETFAPTWDNPAQPAMPWQINLYAFDIAATNPDILYAAPETGGIFKSIDKGLNWVSVSDGYRLGTMEAIAVDPTNETIVYATAGNNLYKTVDGGITWTTTFSITGLNCNDIAIFPTSPNIILLAGGNGLFKSIDAGLTFNIIPSFSGTIYDIETNPLRDNSVYVLRKPVGDSLVRFYQSYDGGSNFSVVNNGWIVGASAAARMTVTAADTNYIYAVLLMGSTIGAPVIMRSTNAGASWTHTCTGIQNSLTGNSSSPLGMSNGQGYYDLSIMVSSINPTAVIVGSTTAYKSMDSGNTFTPLGGYLGSFGIHPDIQEMKMIGNDAWISTDGGLNYSTDFFTATTNHSARNKGIYAADFWGYGQGWNEDLLTGGRYHNGNTAMYDGYPIGNSLRLGGGEAATGFGFVGRDMYVAHSDIGASILPKTFNGSKSNFTFSLYPNEDGYGWDASEMEIYPSCFNQLYIGKDSSLWKSIDGGVSYIQVYNFHQRVKKFEICRSNSLVMYLATNLKLYKTIDGGISWVILTLPSGTSLTKLSISVSFVNADILWITSRSNTSNNKVFKSTDGGVTWTNMTTATINGYKYLVINHQAGTDGGVYITSEDFAKVFYINNTMSDWIEYDSNLPLEYKPLTTKPYYKKSKLRTAGNRGIWEIDFYETGLPIAQATVDKLVSNCIRDTFYFDDFSALNQTAATWQWNFQNASYVSATNIRNPKVMYPALGIYNAILTITQGANTSTDTIQVSILTNDCVADSIPGFAAKLKGNGFNDYISIPPLGMNTNTLTISAWIKADSIEPDYSPIFMYDGQAAGFNFLPGSNHLGFHWPSGPWWWDSGLAVPYGEWAHVAMVVSPTEIRLYLNGKSAAYSFTVPTVNFNLSTSRLGNYQGWGGRYYKGLIDEVTVWNKTLTEDEIRSTRHLTKIPATDSNLIAYYQFNEPNGIVLDKVGVRHASLSSGSTRVVSTGPFAGGSSSKLTITGGGINNFVGTDLEMTFPSIPSATYPNGDVWVSKLNYNPDQNANPYPMVNKYWVVNNYGTDTVFSPLSSISFSGLPALTITTPNSYYLYKRQANNDGNTWATPQDTADTYTLNGNNSNLLFSTNNNITSLGQFSLNALTMPNISVPDLQATTTIELNAYPNPAENILFLDLFSSGTNGSSSISIYDMLGKQLISSKQTIKNGKNVIMLNTTSLSNGIYIVSLELNELKKTQKIIINK